MKPANDTITANDTTAAPAASVPFLSTSASTAPPAREVLKGSEAVYRKTKDLIESPVENFAAFYLDGSGRTIERRTLSIGSTHEVAVDPASAFRPALLLNASAVVFVHNHPSGQHEPSENDVRMTLRLVATGEIIGVKVLDHIVVAAEGYTSIREFTARQALEGLEALAQKLFPPDMGGPTRKPEAKN